MLLRGNRDYYDGCVSLGIDKEIVYNRQPSEEFFHISEVPLFPLDINFEYRHGGDFRVFGLAICGHVFYGAFCRPTYQHEWEIFWSRDAIEDHVKTWKKPIRPKYFRFVRDEQKQHEAIFAVQNGIKNEQVANWQIKNKRVATFFECYHYDRHQMPSRYKDRREHHNNFVYVKHEPCLNDLSFYKVWSSPRAYQEILMWLSNLPKDGPPMIEPSDKTRLEKHGFNKFSFRREKLK